MYYFAPPPCFIVKSFGFWRMRFENRSSPLAQPSGGWLVVLPPVSEVSEAATASSSPRGGGRGDDRGTEMSEALLEAVRGLRVAEPDLGFKPLLAKLREQQPDLGAATKEVAWHWRR